MFYAYLTIAGIAFLFFFILYLVYDLATSNPNKFQDKWFAKTVWIWLPFYALVRLIREVILNEKK